MAAIAQPAVRTMMKAVEEDAAMMKVATWNLERPNADSPGNAAILRELDEVDAEVDAIARSMMNQFAEGHITLREMSAAVDVHVRQMVVGCHLRRAAGEISYSTYTNYIALDSELREVAFPGGTRRWVPVNSEEVS